ncbi:unnamed protein product [Parnassius apollo]|uniref:(apollo) hypothetical protein n=1 Tax=Parnassius apollo TaxID=110799 RepID=A0A8S3WSL4_PARAO|nr:unnamed protein product [Parnassius apollo]
MYILWAFLFVTLFGNLGARLTNTDKNRSHGVKDKASRIENKENFYFRRSYLETNKIYKSNDYDDYSSGLIEPRASMHFHYSAPAYSDAKTPVKVYRPREDPRLFYQSDEYLKEINGKNVNYEVASIYPGREVVRIGEEDIFRTLPTRHLRTRENNRIDFAELNHCVKCPYDITLIAKTGSDRVILQSPRLLSCSGRKAPQNIRFIHLYGPKFGSLLQEGSYSIVGRIMNWDENLQVCKFQVHVVTQSCRTPKSIVAHCKGLNRPCNFTCRDSNLEIYGASSLSCGNDLQWEGNLPICKARNWCKAPLPPDHGRINCIGNPDGEALAGLAEGSRCRVRCEHGWRPHSRTVTVCRRGIWTHSILSCEPINSTQTG